MLHNHDWDSCIFAIDKGIEPNNYNFVLSIILYLNYHMVLNYVHRQSVHHAFFI